MTERFDDTENRLGDKRPEAVLHKILPHWSGKCKPKTA